MTGALTNMVPYILNTSMAILSGVLNLIIAIIVSIYMISDNKNIFYHFKRFLYAVLPKKTQTIHASSVRIVQAFLLIILSANHLTQLLS